MEASRAAERALIAAAAAELEQRKQADQRLALEKKVLAIVQERLKVEQMLTQRTKDNMDVNVLAAAAAKAKAELEVISREQTAHRAQLQREAEELSRQRALADRLAADSAEAKAAAEAEAKRAIAERAAAEAEVRWWCTVCLGVDAAHFPGVWCCRRSVVSVCFILTPVCQLLELTKRKTREIQRTREEEDARAQMLISAEHTMLTLQNARIAAEAQATIETQQVPVSCQWLLLRDDSTLPSCVGPAWLVIDLC
jgi:hypothetical protein